MRVTSCVVAALALAIAACGPSNPAPGDEEGDEDGGDEEGDEDGGDEDRPDAGPPADARPQGVTITGTVWAPGNGPGEVPAGEEIPVAGAVVSITYTGDVLDIPSGAFCERCQPLPQGAVVTDAKGVFSFRRVPPGTPTLVVQKAQFRLTREITVGSEDLALPAEVTTLPSRHDTARGQWTPRIALVVTNSDRLEDVFAKIGMFDVDASGKVVASSLDDNPNIDIYGGYTEISPPYGPAPYPSMHDGTIDQLFGDLERMKGYHLILVPCAYNTEVNAMGTPRIRQNVRDYVAAGGKLYVTDWAGEFVDGPFPEFIEFAPEIDTTRAMEAANSINPVNGDFGHFAEHARAEDPQLRAWLDGQRGTIVSSVGGNEDNGYSGMYIEGQTIDASDFVIEGIWTLIKSLPTVRVTDQDGNPADETGTSWVSGDYLGARSPHTVTFEPSCGRVMFSTYHTANRVHRGLVPQERVLLYLLLEIGACVPEPEG
jgi:hypothetical protein